MHKLLDLLRCRGIILKRLLFGINAFHESCSRRTIYEIVPGHVFFGILLIALGSLQQTGLRVQGPLRPIVLLASIYQNVVHLMVVYAA
jgi:hypothetical protein